MNTRMHTLFQRAAVCHCVPLLSAGRPPPLTRSRRGLVDHTAAAHTVAA